MLSSPCAEFEQDPLIVFPGEICCNCGRAENVAILEQKTRWIRFDPLPKTELMFSFPLPFCADCEPSSRRQPLTLLQGVILLAVVFLMVMMAIFIAGEWLSSDWLVDNGHTLAAVLIAVVAGSWYGTRRRRPGQSSYDQPFRVLRVRREFLSDKILCIRFGMTLPEYASRFRAANAAAIESGAIEVEELR